MNKLIGGYDMKHYLETIDISTVSPFTAFVIEDILDNIEDNPKYIDEVLEYGCQSGIVSSLTYYYQTESIFKQFYSEILEIYNEVKLDVNFEINANNLVWLAYEHVCIEVLYEYQIGDE